ALANLGEAAAPPRSAAPRQQPPAAEEEPPRRGRRRRGPVDDAPPAAPPEEQPPGRRGRRKRARRDDEPAGGFLDDAPESDDPFSGGFPGVSSSADTGAFAAVDVPPSRRPRRARAEDPEPDTGSGAFAAGGFDEDAQPRGRRARRARASAGDEEPRGRRGGGRRRRGGAAEEPARAEEPAPAFERDYDTGGFAVEEDPEPDTGSGAFAEEDAAEDPEPRGRRARRARASAGDEEPRGRRGGGRRRRGGAAEEPARAEEPAPAFGRDYDTGGFAVEEDPEPDTGSGAFAEEDAAEDPEPRGRRSRRARADEDEEPRGRRGGGRRRRGRREEPEEDPEEYEYEEPKLSDIAEAYGGGRSSRRKAKELRRARANAGKAGRLRRRRNKTLMVVLALALLLVVAGGGYAVMRAYVFPADFEGQGSGEVIVVVEKGDAGSTVGDRLADLGVVASSRAFTNALDAVPPEELGDGLVPGTYALASGMSGEAAVAALLNPDNRVGGRITVREGLPSEEALEILAENTDVTLEELQEAYARTDELGLPEYATEGPAGYLFPATYRFDPGTEALSMLKIMVQQHHQVAEEIDLEGRAAALGYDPNEIMAIASIVQAETGTEEDMPLISAVVHNRMELNMELQMDSTCFYVLGEKGTFLNNEQRASCEADPRGYSTYGMVGLPAGPFVAPGEAAIEAALEPADVDYLYFALTDPENGETGFSTTLEEHNQMVAENQAEW
ncbi:MULTISPECIES: endolytic transglycosylase MltG, partial [unclassified Nocardiopsis]|uniref:endolytic transglycosylase MltG n=1 Tax=unclassified Nocardiopsis TaxID=2649073 RepID=UPI001F1BE0E9